MAILIHVIIALSSIVYSSFVFISPSAKKLKVTYTFIGATFASGTYLVLTMPSHLVSACFSGLTYLGVILTLTLAAHYRLVAKNNRSN